MKVWRQTAILGNESGYILVLSMLILVILTLLGVAGIRNTTIELNVAGNERIAAVNFYNSEAAAYEGAQTVLNLDGEKDTEKLLPPTSEVTLADTDLIRTAKDETVLLADLKNLDSNSDAKIDKDDITHFATSSIEGDVQNVDATAILKNVVVLNSIPSGSSLGLGSSRLYDYAAYGYAESSGKSIVKVGVKKRF